MPDELDPKHPPVVPASGGGETQPPLAGHSPGCGPEHGFRAGAGRDSLTARTARRDSTTRFIEITRGVLSYSELAPSGESTIHGGVFRISAFLAGSSRASQTSNGFIAWGAWPLPLGRIPFVRNRVPFFKLRCYVMTPFAHLPRGLGPPFARSPVGRCFLRATRPMVFDQMQGGKDLN